MWVWLVRHLPGFHALLMRHEVTPPPDVPPPPTVRVSPPEFFARLDARDAEIDARLQELERRVQMRALTTRKRST